MPSVRGVFAGQSVAIIKSDIGSGSDSGNREEIKEDDERESKALARTRMMIGRKKTSNENV
jgi:hypothetical protein